MTRGYYNGEWDLYKYFMMVVIESLSTNELSKPKIWDSRINDEINLIEFCLVKNVYIVKTFSNIGSPKLS